ncbi:MAG: L-seryl-tRNA(Sec) selenium transferase [Actinomycetota bacterium]
MTTDSSQLRSLPQVDRLSNALPAEIAAPVRVLAARHVIAQATGQILAGDDPPSFDDLVERSNLAIRTGMRRLLGRVINATGVLLHTNLGRAPLSSAALEAAAEVGSGYSNLEYDLEASSRGSRYSHAMELLRAVTGAECALVVNNNAAAVVLALRTLAQGREVIVSRGELIEIGGEFRLPDIMAESGAIMREVGTTNRTHLSDYESAINEQTAAIVKIHPSNFSVVGFTASVASAKLASLCRARGIIFIHDLGSGLLRHSIGGTRPAWLTQEPSVEQALQAGTDLVTFSSDKLLGGPQAGIAVGKQEVIDRLHSSPLLRAFRVDKTTLAALQSTLLAYLENRETSLPLWQMALLTPEDLELRSKSVVDALGVRAGPESDIEVVRGNSAAGGGSAPGAEIPTALIKISCKNFSGAQLSKSLVENDPPIIGRVEDEALTLDLRTVAEQDDQVVAGALRRILAFCM